MHQRSFALGQQRVSEVVEGALTALAPVAFAPWPVVVGAPGPNVVALATGTIERPWMAAALGAAYTLGGRVADAVPLLTQAIEQAIATERVVCQGLCSLPLGEAHLQAGRLEAAHVLAERALALARAHQERGNQAYALCLLGEIRARREPPERERAEGHYQEALALAEELGMRPLQAHCHLGLGKLYLKIARREQARAELSATITLYRAMEMTFWLPPAEAALAQVEGC